MSDTRHKGCEQAGFGQAHGKVILLGEHAVVYGRPALAAGLPHGASARARFSDEPASSLAVVPWNVDVRPGGGGSLAQAFGALLHAAGVERSVRVEATVELPGGSGLGSSAALGCAVLRALDALRGLPPRPHDEALEITLAWERVFHGNPSGVDNAVAWSGGLVFYERGRPLTPIRPRSPFMLVIGDSGQTCSTRITVSEVARQHKRHRERIEKCFDAIAAIVRNGRLAIERGDLRALGQLFDMNHSLLASMLVSTETLEEMIATARAAGALGAKLTGGGGGGCMIAVVSDQEIGIRVRDALIAGGKRAFLTTIGAPPQEAR
jgi:mevalonate kinase